MAEVSIEGRQSQLILAHGCRCVADVLGVIEDKKRIQTKGHPKSKRDRFAVSGITA